MRCTEGSDSRRCFQLTCNGEDTRIESKCVTSETQSVLGAEVNERCLVLEEFSQAQVLEEAHVCGRFGVLLVPQEIIWGTTESRF